jgi:hypothetical protein
VDNLLDIMGYYVMVLDRKDNQKMNDYLPITSQELKDQEELLSMMKQAIHMYMNGLNDNQKQMVRDMLSVLKDENVNQPDWSNMDYLKSMLEIVYLRGCAVGHIKGMKASHKLFTDSLSKK